MAYQEARAQHESKDFTFTLKSDGSFRVDDVPEGSYRLVAKCSEPATSGSHGETIALIQHEFTVSGTPGTVDHKQLDLGILQLVPATRLEPGEPAPLFQVHTIDGKTLKLADYRGKYVLLEFWATWCAPCRVEIPHLQAVYEAFGDNKHFTMISLSLDSDLVAPKAYVAQNRLEWIQGFLGNWSKTDIPGKYGVEGIPEIFLIGPDGRIITKGLRGEAIKSAVVRALPD